MVTTPMGMSVGRALTLLNQQTAAPGAPSEGEPDPALTHHSAI